MWVHVIPHDPFRLIPQKIQSGKDPSREARKFTGLENFVPIPYCDCPLRTRPAVQIHDCHLYIGAMKIEKNKIVDHGLFQETLIRLIFFLLFS